MDFTTDERRILQMLVNGATNKQVADAMGIALRTAELRRHKIMLKLRAESPAQLGYKYAMLELKRSGFEPPAM